MHNRNESKNKQGNNPLVLIQDVLTRWNSLYLMLERFIKLFNYVKQVINGTTSEKHEMYRTNINLINKEVLSRLEAVLEILLPFFKLTVILSAEKKYVTI